MKSNNFQIRTILPSLLRISLGIVYIWFGILKFFPNQSPAEDIARQTIDRIMFGLIPSEFSYLMLAAVETVIGILLLFNLWSKYVVYLALGHLFMTFSPLLLFPAMTFDSAGIPTLLGQYILKNIVLICGLLMVNKKVYDGSSRAKTC